MERKSKKSKHGGFRPGSGRRPGSINKRTRALKELAGEHTETAVKVLCEIMSDTDAPHSARIVAADKLLDRAHGKPAIMIEPSSTMVDPEMMDRLKNEMMERMAKARSRQRDVLIERGIIIEGEVMRNE